MIDFDNKLIDSVNSLAADVDAFKNALSSGDTANLKDKIQSVTNEVEALEDTFDKREEVVLGVT